MREIIKVKNVSKVYKINKRKSGLFGAVLNLFAPRYEKKIAVSDMNFSIEEGEAVAFIGSNGAGKSTTIKMLSGILYPSEGEITVASYVPYKQRKKYVSNIGVVLGQKSQLVWDLPVRDGYELIRHIYKISKEDYEKRLDEFIEMLDMKEFINQPVDNWPHLFIYKGYNYDTKMFRILDNIHMHTTKYKDLRYSDFFLSEDTVRKLYEEQGRVYDREFGFVVFNKNEYFGVKSDRQIVLTILRQLCMPNTGFKYRQIVKLISLNEALINGSIDNRQLKDLAKKILNINKYKTVMLNELSINMMENGYDTIYINRIKELADLLYAEWSDYVTVSVSKIKRKRFDSPEAVTESIEKMEDEIVSITKGYIDFLEKDEGTDRENKKISNEIIFVEEGKIIFSITDGKTHNFWFEDKAPKYPLLKNCNDDKIFAKARILFNQESEENLYQAGIYVKSAEDKVYYMAIDNDRNCILDTIGENNRKEEFDNTNEYLIKMNLEADCLKVQFISDASTKELKMMIERLAPVEVGLMVKTWGNGGFLEVDFKESQAIISNK